MRSALTADGHSQVLLNNTPLVGITAAVVGVILNLAVFFGYHVLWPHGLAQPFSVATMLSGFEWIAALIGAAAFVALWRYKVGIIPVVLVCGAAGFLHHVLI